MKNKRIVFASGNPDKLIEVREVLAGLDIEVLGTRDMGLEKFEVVEDGSSLHENAFKKAYELYQELKLPVFADDTGLFVDYLGGEPGVYSARYSGEGATYASNRAKLLSELSEARGPERRAYFMTVIAYYDGKDRLFFEGRIEGHITEEERGDRGFGYDAIFMPEGYDRTFAELSLEEKSGISHRARSLFKFRDYLTQYQEARLESHTC